MVWKQKHDSVQKEIEKKVCVSENLPSLGEKEEWWSRAIGVNERVHMLCESMNCAYLDVWKDFIDSFKLYKKRWSASE